MFRGGEIIEIRKIKKSKISVDKAVGHCYNNHRSVRNTANSDRFRPEKYGGIAQLGERLNGIQEVSGSIPLISTKSTGKQLKRLFPGAFLCFWLLFRVRRNTRLQSPAQL